MSILKRYMSPLNPPWPPWPSSPLRRALLSVAAYLVLLGVVHVLAALTGIAEWTASLILTAVLVFSMVMAIMVPLIRRLRRETAARRNASDAAGLRE